MKHIALKITAFIFGIALWLYVVSLNTFKVDLDIPVRLVKLPEMLAIASKPPHTMRVTLEGEPFDLMRLRSKILNGDTTAAAIIVDLQDAELGATRRHIGEKNFSAPGFSNIKFIEPDNQLLFIDLDLDTRIERSVPIHYMATFEAATGYLLTDEPKLNPDFITVSGARNVITRIIEIPTDSVAFSSLEHDTTYSIPLDFSQFPAHVSPGDSITSISVNIQKIGKKFFREIPVQLIGIFDHESYKLNPASVSVEITGGEGTLDSIGNGNIELFVEFNRFQIEDVDSLTPTIKLLLPSGVNREMSIKAIQLSPDKVSLQDIKKESVQAVADSLDDDSEGALE
jgi:YbbR domain-containing protein